MALLKDKFYLIALKSPNGQAPNFAKVLYWRFYPIQVHFSTQK